MKGSDLLAGAAKGAVYNMALQVSIRMMTFVLNAVVLRYVTKELLGVVNVRLTLLYSTTLFMSTECFDQACLSKLEDKNWKQVVNVMWCSLPLAMFWCSLLGWVWMFLLENPDPEQIPYYRLGVVCFAVSTLINTVARPHFIVGQCYLFMKTRVLSVGVSELVKCVICAVLVVYYPHLGLIIFAVAQVVCSMVYTAIYYATFYHYTKDPTKSPEFVFQSLRDFFPQKVKDKPAVDDRLMTLSKSFFMQGFLKQFLTEGEKYVMTVFGVLNFGDQGIYDVIDNTGAALKELYDSLQYFFYPAMDREKSCSDQWVYDIINNLGSLAPRFLFMPLEESGRLMFSRSLVRANSCLQQPKESVDLATKVLKYLLKFVMLCGLTILTFGYPYSYLALDLYGGRILSTGSGPLLLRWYCLYVLVIAINGTTECFHFAAMNNDQIKKYNWKMFLFSLVFLGSSLILTKQFGSVGFILANCLNMGTRIAYSTYFIHQYYKGSRYRPLEGLIPSIPVVISLLCSLAVTVTSENLFCCHQGALYRLIHIGIGGFCLACVMLTIYFYERDLIYFVQKQYLLSRKDKTHEQLKKES